jgi:hypothetical protein
MTDIKNVSDVPHILTREIQAPLTASLIKGFEEEFGREKAIETTQKTICNDAILSGKALAEKYADNSLKTMLKIVQDVWAKDGIMEIDNVSLDHKTLCFDVTHCGYALMYERLGLKPYGNLLSCSRDFAFMEGFTPDIELTRTKTIMQGDKICNFRYTLK